VAVEGPPLRAVRPAQGGGQRSESERLAPNFTAGAGLHSHAATQARSRRLGPTSTADRLSEARLMPKR
jgi:hypothetical protein